MTSATIFIRDNISHGDIVVKKIGTADNLADMLSKPFPIAKFMLGLDWYVQHLRFPFRVWWRRWRKISTIWCNLIQFKPRWRFVSVTLSWLESML